MLKPTHVTQLIALGLTLSITTAADAHACARKGPLDKRITDCSRVIATQPAGSKAVEALIIRGETYARKGMNAKAITDFTRALKTEPSRTEAHRGRGNAFVAARKFDAAIADFTEVLRRNPGDASAHTTRGYAYLATRRPQQAVEDFTAALRIDPQSQLALNNRGLAYKKLGKVKQAIADFTLAVNLNPLYALAYNNRGYAYETQGRTAEAIDDFRRALMIDPTLVGARDGLTRLKAHSIHAERSSQHIALGQIVAKKNCAWCHAIGEQDKSPHASAPPFRDIHQRHPVLALRQPISRAVVTPHDDMPKLQLSDIQVDQIVAYINSLKPKR